MDYQKKPSTKYIEPATQSYTAPKSNASSGFDLDMSKKDKLDDEFETF